MTERDRRRDMTPREARDRYLDKRRVERRDQSISAYHYRLKLFVEWAEEQGIERMTELTGWDLDTYEAHRRAQDVTPNTLKNELTTLRNWLRYCARIEIVDEDLPEKVEIPDVDRDEESSDVRLEPDEAIELLEYYRGDPNQVGTRRHVLLELAWVTGARAGGLRALDVQDFEAIESEEDDPVHFVRFVHRAETPLKNGRDGERPVALPEPVANAVGTYIRQDREDVVDENGRQPLLASQRGRPSAGTIRDWMYQATIPCVHSPCPHDRDPQTCEFTSYTHASKCPSSRSPHQVRTGAITWMLNRGVPVEVVAERVNAGVDVIEKHYDKEEAVREMEERRLPYLDRLDLNSTDQT